MNRSLSTWLATLAVAACLSQAAIAQTVHYDWTTTDEYRTTVAPIKLTAAQRADLEAAIRAQGGDVEPVFVQERTELVRLLTPEQLVIYDQLLTPRYYYSYGLMTPEEWAGYRSNVVTRLGLTPTQQAGYTTVVTRSDSALTPIATRYVSRYTSVLSPTDWTAYRTGATRSFLSGLSSSASSSQSSSSSSAASSSSEEYRRSYKETTITTTPVHAEVTTQVTTAPAAPARRTTRAVNWRNQDLK